MDALGIKYQDRDVSLARVDVCADVWAPNHELYPYSFVMDSNTKRATHTDRDDFKTHGTSGVT
ncbi:hypothetical protein [Ascidiaceihabitans sp.]|uniref:hypothetical protein n=1 Tax=Ascidiaceihabitans sp. TaxID=1872644 RepID=UPI0032991723